MAKNDKIKLPMRPATEIHGGSTWFTIAEDYEDVVRTMKLVKQGLADPIQEVLTSRNVRFTVDFSQIWAAFPCDE